VSITPYIDPGFQKTVEDHIFGNTLLEVTESPLILGIFGPSGEGKTFQVQTVCNSLGLNQFLISPGELESENAGHPGYLLRKQYLEAGDASPTGNSARGILIINDIDTVLGDWGSLVQYTVNRQVVYAQLMALCDFPLSVAGTTCNRVPIIVTGNDPSILYKPLTRPGRMRLYEWAPDAEQRAHAVAPLLPQLTGPEVISLINEFPERPVAFWADVSAALWEAQLAAWVNAQPRAFLIQMLRDGDVLQMERPRSQVSEIRLLAKRLRSSDVSGRSFL